MLCDEGVSDVNSLVNHLKSDDHKKFLSLAKITLLKRNMNRWPFNDGILFFDSSIQEEDISYPAKKKEFIKDPRGFKSVQDCLRAIDDDDQLSIENFQYDPEILNPRVKAYSGRFLVQAHSDTLKIGKARIFGRFVSDKRIDKLWSEWMGKDANDLTSSELEDPENKLTRVVVMRQMDWMARICGICNREKLGGRDVASLLEPPGSGFGNILCCSYANFRARKNKDRSADPASRVKVFHTFHLSCLIHWIMWCEREQLKKEAEDINKIYDIFCPTCNTDENGNECYQKSEVWFLFSDFCIEC
jgi:hypothetical protein